MKKNNKKGFTLVELVIVVAVMAVLVAVAIPTIGSIKEAADSAVLETNCRTMESIIKLAEAEKAAGDTGTVTISQDEIVTALGNAKLGITSGTYSYLSNGQVISGSTAPSGTGAASIVATWNFASTGAVSGGAASGGAGSGT